MRLCVEGLEQLGVGELTPSVCTRASDRARLNPTIRLYNAAYLFEVSRLGLYFYRTHADLLGRKTFHPVRAYTFHIAAVLHLEA